MSEEIEKALHLACYAMTGCELTHADCEILLNELDALRARIEELELRLDVYNGNMYDVVCDENSKLRTRIAELEAEQRWIPVNEEMPGTDSKVIVLLESHPPESDLCFYRHGKFLTFSGLGVSHWMPKPPPPDTCDMEDE